MLKDVVNFGAQKAKMETKNQGLEDESFFWKAGVGAEKTIR